MKYMLKLQRFAEEGTGSAAPEAAGAETAAAVETTDIQAGETLADGSVVTPQVAAAMNQQMAKHPELREVYGKARTRAQRQAPAAQAEEPAEKTTEQEWEELKKGKYKDLYGRDVQGAINQRFKKRRFPRPVFAHQKRDRCRDAQVEILHKWKRKRELVPFSILRYLASDICQIYLYVSHWLLDLVIGNTLHAST